MFIKKTAEWHKKIGGKIKVKGNVGCLCSSKLKRMFGTGLTPILEEIKQEPVKIWDYSLKGNTVGFISNGSGLSGDHSANPALALPLLEAQAALLNKLTNLNGIPITTSKSKASDIAKLMIETQAGFCAFVTTDIGADECFKISMDNEKALKVPCINIGNDCGPVALLAALINACRFTGKNLKKLKVVIEGHYPVLTQVIPLLMASKIKDIKLITDKKTITKANVAQQSQVIQDVIAANNLVLPSKVMSKTDTAKGADVYITLRGSEELTSETIESMSEAPWIFALNHPEASISYISAKASRVAIYCTNQVAKKNSINSLVAFPGIVKALASREIPVLTNEIKIRAAYGIANTIPKEKMHANKILPSVLHRKLTDNIYNEIMKDIEEQKVVG